MINTVLFDLDGTLLDTAPDMSNALNELRSMHDLPPLPHELIRPTVGYGSRDMLKLAFDVDESHPRYTRLLEDFLQAYQTNLCKTTQLFPGMEKVLHHLETSNLTWGIVTNKPSRFTFDLLKSLHLEHRAACIICGDSLSKRKPDPDQILHACSLLQCSPTDTLYVGDTIVDVIASKAAGTRSLVALYGYVKPQENPHTWNADGYIQEPLEIIDWINTFA